MRLGDNGPPPVAIPILLQDGLWQATCPECDGEDGKSGCYDERAKAERWRGLHLVAKHGAEHFEAGSSDASALRHVQSRRRYRQRQREGEIKQ